MTEKGPAGENAPSAATIDEAFELLRSPRRRYALEHLAERNENSVPLKRLAEYVRERERAADDSGGVDECETDVYQELYHAHVPRLEAAGVAIYAETDDAVELRELSEPLTRCLALSREFDSTE